MWGWAGSELPAGLRPPGSKARQSPRDLEAKQSRRSEQRGFLERPQSIAGPAEPDTTRSVDRAARHAHMKDKVHLFHNKGQCKSLHGPLPLAGHEPAPPTLPAQVRHAQSPQQGWRAGQTVGALTIRSGECSQRADRRAGRNCTHSSAPQDSEEPKGHTGFSYNFCR